MPLGSFTWNKTAMPDLRPVVRFARSYFDLEVEGIERVPRAGRTVVVANHGGWLAFDGVVVASLLYDRFGPERMPIGFVEDILFRLPVLGRFAERIGAVGVSEFQRWHEFARFHDVFGIFPEGTEGNCKPLSEAYRLQEFRRGFVRLALSLGARVSPVTIVGSDETFPVLYKWRSPKNWIGSIVPVPMCWVPLPVRWKVIFHEPLDFSVYDPDKVGDSLFCRRLAEEVRGIIQSQLDREVRQRGSFPLAVNASRLRQWLQNRRQNSSSQGPASESAPTLDLSMLEPVLTPLRPEERARVAPHLLRTRMMPGSLPGRDGWNPHMGPMG